MKVLALLSDGFGGHGGIAQYNRDLLTAMAGDPAVSEVIAFPRLVHHDRDEVPPRIRHVRSGLGGRLNYVLALLRFALTGERVELVLCCHINLLPLSWIVARLRSVPLVLTVFGIDAWQPTSSPFANWILRRVDGCIAISRYTRSRLLQWADLPGDRVWILPNAIRLEPFAGGVRHAEMLSKHGLEGRKVVMTFGRLAAGEPGKGFDEMLEALPEMLRREPKIAYVVVGDGNDRARLERKAKDLGVAEHVRFAGMIPEAEKADYYALADAYVMPCRGEGFGFVFLEAMASGVPAVASVLDGSRDPAADGVLAKLVNPDDRSALVEAALAALQQPRRVPETLRRFSFDEFSRHLRAILAQVRAASGVLLATPE